METVTEPGGLIFKIKRFSVHDGPGIRTSVFLKGCSLNCIWCHSPEGIDSEVTLWHNTSLCIGCGQCVKECPFSALTLLKEKENIITIDRSKCLLSGECIKCCPTGALSFTGYKASVSAVIDEIEKDLLYYRVSGGGVTITGGEPMFQPAFTFNILTECKIRNIDTAIETSLFCEQETVKRIMGLTDLFIVDIKIFDNDSHYRFTGKSNEIIKSNFQYLAKAGRSILVRVPLIKGITDLPDNLNDIERFVNETDSKIQIEHISYNPLAENNYKRLGIPFLPGSKLL